MTTEDVGQGSREYAPSTRLAVIAAGELFLLVAMPWLLALLGRQADRNLATPRIGYGYPSVVLGSLLIIVGLFFGIWSVSRLFSLGRGTPLPLMPTQKLVVRSPYSYCRNPMAFGMILFYLGFGIAIGSVGAVALASVFALGLLVYIRATEERGLRARFGKEYLEYKRRTPFLIPRFWRRDSLDFSGGTRAT